MNYFFRYFLLLVFSGICINAGAQELKVMTYNIHHGFDAAEKSDQLVNIARLIKSSGAELVGLQEVDSMCIRSGKVDQAKRLAELTGMYYAYVPHFPYEGGSYGLAVLSKFPVSGVENNRLPFRGPQGDETRALLTARISVSPRKDICFAVVHYSGQVRLNQAEVTVATLKSRNIPSILTGDLNETPDSKVVQTLSTYLQDTNQTTIKTVADNNPKTKIDYVFVSRPDLAEVLDEKVFNEYYSDHFPVMVTVKLK